MGYRLSLLPSSAQGPGGEWGSVLDASRTRAGFEAVHGDDVRQQTVADYLLFDRSNPSSVTNCLDRARANARVMRIALTTEMWVAINDAWHAWQQVLPSRASGGGLDRKSTRLNSSHVKISYAVFCLKKKNNIIWHQD